MPHELSQGARVQPESMQSCTCKKCTFNLVCGLFNQVDTWRAARTGFPEVIWGPGKSAEQIAAIMSRLAETEAAVIATRVTPEVRFTSHIQQIASESSYHAANYTMSTAAQKPGCTSKSNQLSDPHMQVYHQVHALLPDVHYSALAKVLSLKTPGKRKQERLPGELKQVLYFSHA